MPLINLNGSSNSDTIAEPRIDPLIARDSEVTAAVNSHVAATNPHTQYLLSANHNAHAFDGGNSKGLAYSGGTLVSETNNCFEIRSRDTSSAAYLSFHRPGIYACQVGLDSDNQFKIGGWSMGANSYPIWHGGNHGVSGDPHTQYLTQARGDARYIGAWNSHSRADWAFLPAQQLFLINLKGSLTISTANSFVPLGLPPIYGAPPPGFSGWYPASGVSHIVPIYRSSDSLLVPAAVSCDGSSGFIRSSATGVFNLSGTFVCRAVLVAET